MACRSFLLEFGMPRTESSSATSLSHLDFHRMSSDTSPRRGPWTQHKVGRGRQVLWPHDMFLVDFFSRISNLG